MRPHRRPRPRPLLAGLRVEPQRGVARDAGERGGARPLLRGVVVEVEDAGAGGAGAAAALDVALGGGEAAAEAVLEIQ